MKYYDYKNRNKLQEINFKEKLKSSGLEYWTDEVDWNWSTA